jgi:glycosyltransferase involved in cell wall biosynthesis
VDTREIQEHVKRLTIQDRTGLGAQLNIPTAAPVGIFCGVLDKSKSLPFLLEASELIKAANPDFHLILVGTGPGEEELKKRIGGLSWVHWAGPQFGKVKAGLLAIADVFLLPSAVGLAILDAFAGGLPIITTRHPTHGPEIEYLEEGVNGLITDHLPWAYAEAVTSLLAGKDFLARLQAGAKTSAEKYSIENMAANFGNGIQSCLGLSETIRKPLEFQRAS